MAHPSYVTYVTVRFPGEGTALGLVTKAHPGSCVDLLVDSMQDGPDGLRHSAVALARRLPRPAVDALFTELAQRYDIEARPIRSNPDGSVAFRWTLDAGSVRSAALRTLARFQADFRAPWAHVAGGNLAIRAEVQEPGREDEQVARIRAALADAGLAADVEAAPLQEGEQAALRELEALRGSAPPPGRPSSWAKIDSGLARQERPAAPEAADAPPAK